MKHSFTRRVALTLGAALVAGAAAPAIAQNYPDKPVRLVVNFPPGGAADRIARLVAQPLQDALGQTIIVENKGGANGNIGGDYVAKAASDGYTLLMSSGSMVSVNPHLYSSMSYDPLKDLTPVAAVAKVMLYLVAREDKMPSDLEGFLKKIKDNPGKLSYASPGNGSSPHLGMALLEQATGVRGIHVPYRGAGPALQDRQHRSRLDPLAFLYVPLDTHLGIERAVAGVEPRPPAHHGIFLAQQVGAVSLIGQQRSGHVAAADVLG